MTQRFLLLIFLAILAVSCLKPKENIIYRPSAPVEKPKETYLVFKTYLNEGSDPKYWVRYIYINSKMSNVSSLGECGNSYYKDYVLNDTDFTKGYLPYRIEYYDYRAGGITEKTDTGRFSVDQLAKDQCNLLEVTTDGKVMRLSK